MNNIADQLEIAHRSIANFAAKRLNYKHQVDLLAVSKTKPVSDIIEAYHAGQRAFGENYVQEAVNKITELTSYPDMQWHFIGPLQSNKSKLVAENFDWVQTVDRAKIARRLSEQRPANKSPLNILLQVNISEEPQKGGVLVDQVIPLAEQILAYPNLCLRGIMTIPRRHTDHKELQREFSQMREIFDKLASKHQSVDTLSMGMSGDLGDAILCGTTMVRLGTAIFGERN